jgi:NAD(P)-dependent dehydrogenase (short-subunit alcohol dehydrogenase family)
MSGRLQNKTCIITGAGSGFGKGIAERFAAEGARVLAADISKEKLHELETADQTGLVRTIYANAAQRADWEMVLASAVAEFGGVDVVVNNAGASYPNKPTEDVTDADLDLCMSVNVGSVYTSTSVLLPYFIKNGRPGCFIQIASTGGIRPRPGLTWYNASKAAIICASKCMAVEYGPKNIRFNSVSPVVGSTGMYAKT